MEPEQMSDTIQSPHTVVVTQKPAQTFDPKDVVEAAKGVVSGDGKGFMPLTDFPPTKPYEDWQYFLEKQRDELNQEHFLKNRPKNSKQRKTGLNSGANLILRHTFPISNRGVKSASLIKRSTMAMESVGEKMKSINWKPKSKYLRRKRSPL